MNERYYTMKDVNGVFVTIPEAEFVEQLLAQGFKLFGMDLTAILTLREMYERHGGAVPITEELIREVLE